MSLYKPGSKHGDFYIRDIIAEANEDHAIMKNGERISWEHISPMPFTEIPPQLLGFFPDTDSHEWVYKDNPDIRYKPGTFNSVHELQNFLSDRTGRKMDGVLFVE